MCVCHMCIKVATYLLAWLMNSNDRYDNDATDQRPENRHQHDRRLNIRLHHYAAAAAADYDDDDDALTSPGPYDTHDPVGL